MLPTAVRYVSNYQHSGSPVARSGLEWTRVDQIGPEWSMECGVLSPNIAYDQNLMIAYKSNTLFKHYLSRKCGRDAGVCWDLRL